jgi:hypothetical protein
MRPGGARQPSCSARMRRDSLPFVRHAQAIKTCCSCLKVIATRSALLPPWTVEELDACFVVRHHNGQALARPVKMRQHQCNHCSVPAEISGSFLSAGNSGPQCPQSGAMRRTELPNARRACAAACISAAFPAVQQIRRGLAIPPPISATPPYQGQWPLFADILLHFVYNAHSQSWLSFLGPGVWLLTPPCGRFIRLGLEYGSPAKQTDLGKRRHRRLTLCSARLLHRRESGNPAKNKRVGR